MPNPFPEIELVPERGKAYESSLLSVTGQEDSGLLFESLQESLGINQFASPRGLLIPSAEASHLQGAKQNNVDSTLHATDEANSEGVKLSSTSSGEGVKVPGGAPLNADDTTPLRQLRKSARVRRERAEDAPKPTKNNVRRFFRRSNSNISWHHSSCESFGGREPAGVLLYMYVL